MAGQDNTHVHTIRHLQQHGSVTLHVYIKVARRLRLRLWLSTQLIMLAAWVAGVGIEVHELEEVD